MAETENDATEDLLLHKSTAGPADDVESDNEVQDFRVLRSMLSGNAGRSKNVQLPKRGEKTISLDTTEKQASMIEASRQATFEVLSYERSHIPKSRICALYDPSTNGAWVLKVKGNLFNTIGKWRKRRTTTVDVSEETIPVVNNLDEATDPVLPSFSHPSDDEKTSLKGGLWLQPEEAIYMLERGTLDIRLSLQEDFDFVWCAMEKDRTDIVDALTEPVSLQAAYTFFLGRPEAQSEGRWDENPFLTLEMYQVYAYLRRLGYNVVRAGRTDVESEDNSQLSVAKVSTTPGFPSLFPFFSQAEKTITNPVRPVHHYNQLAVRGPICLPGLYRSYCDVFAQLKLIPFHHPNGSTHMPSIPYFLNPALIIPESQRRETGDNGVLVPSQRTVPRSTNPPLRVTFNVYKPSTHYSKKSEPPPDFRIAVVPARSSKNSTSAAPLDCPDLSALLASTPPRPAPDVRRPRQNNNTRGGSSTIWSSLRQCWKWVRQVPVLALCTIIPALEKQLKYSTTQVPDPRGYYQRLKHGHRAVIIAVVDCGIVSFFQLTDAAFALTDIDWRYFEPKSRGNDGKGPGRGRSGRGRGRGGRGGRGGRK